MIIYYRRDHGVDDGLGIKQLILSEDPDTSGIGRFRLLRLMIGRAPFLK